MNFTNRPRGIVRGAGKRLETRQSDCPVKRQSLMSRCNRVIIPNAAGADTGLAPAHSRESVAGVRKAGLAKGGKRCRSTHGRCKSCTPCPITAI